MNSNINSRDIIVEKQLIMNKKECELFLVIASKTDKILHWFPKLIFYVIGYSLILHIHCTSYLRKVGYDIK